MKQYFFQFVFIILLAKSSFAIEPLTYAVDTLQNNIDENQIKKRYISVGLVMAHFSAINNSPESDYETSLFNPGGELLVNFNLKNKLGFSTGLYYQYGKAENAFVKERLVFGELSLPVILNIILAHSEQNRFTLSSGFYIGQYIHVKKEVSGDKLTSDNGWHELPTEFIDGYTSESLITDFYMGLGYREFNNRNGFFQFNLFTKYRLNEHWLNHDISKFIFGVKINHFFKF
jgi:hypothetical protein